MVLDKFTYQFIYLCFLGNFYCIRFVHYDDIYRAVNIAGGMSVRGKD